MGRGSCDTTSESPPGERRWTDASCARQNSPQVYALCVRAACVMFVALARPRREIFPTDGPTEPNAHRTNVRRKPTSKVNDEILAAAATVSPARHLASAAARGV